MTYFNSQNKPYPKTLSGFTTILKKCLDETLIEESLYLLKKYELIQVNSKKQISYSPILFAN